MVKCQHLIEHPIKKQNKEACGLRLLSKTPHVLGQGGAGAGCGTSLVLALCKHCVLN